MLPLYFVLGFFMVLCVLYAAAGFRNAMRDHWPDR